MAINFDNALGIHAEALRVRGQRAEMLASNLANVPENPQVQYRTTVQDSLDGNTVDEQIEQAQFMQNAVQYQATLEFLGGKFQSLTKALRGD